MNPSVKERVNVQLNYQTGGSLLEIIQYQEQHCRQIAKRGTSDTPMTHDVVHTYPVL